MIFGKNINKYYLKYWYLILLGIIALVIVDICDSVIPPKIIGNIIDRLNGVDGIYLTQEVLVRSVLSLLVLVFISFVCRFLWRIGFFTASHKVGEDLRHRMFDNSLTLSQTFYSSQKVGGLMSYYINDVNSVKESFGWGTMMIFDTIFLIPLVLSQMFTINWVISVILLVPLSIICIMALVIGKYLELRYKDRQDKFEELSDLTQESISGIRVIKAFVREAKELREFKKKNKENEESNMKYLRLSVLFDNLIDFLIWSIYFVIIAIGSYIVLNMGTITAGDLTELVAYFDTLLWPMFAIGEIISIHSKGKASLKRVDEILDTKTDLIEDENPVEIEELRGDITFNHLSFKFPDSKEAYALRDVSFEIKSGEFIGIIGKTGSSKTTLVNLLLRLYNVDENEIFIDGIDIMKYRIKDIRAHIGYVPQDNFLYSTSIESNIAFSAYNPSREKVEREAKIAGVHSDIIGFPKGYDTILGERGVSVSGGQKQRISIARALYKEPNILILDDSLSAVDTKTESEILNYLKSERKGKTTILIAHRISSIKDADKILVLEEGGIVSGFDSHENLLRNNQTYKETFDLQKLEEEGGINHA